MSPGQDIGALVSIEQTQTLQEQIATGIPLDAVVTGELLINIFIPNTPLHDGAVIIRDNRVATACSYLPLTESNKISKEFGTRHRAAIGLSEQTDALTFCCVRGDWCDFHCLQGKFHPMIFLFKNLKKS